MAQNVVAYFGGSSIWSWQECRFCCCWMNYSSPLNMSLNYKGPLICGYLNKSFISYACPSCLPFHFFHLCHWWDRNTNLSSSSLSSACSMWRWWRMKTLMMIHFHLMSNKYIFSSLCFSLYFLFSGLLYCENTVYNTYNIQNTC